MGRDGFGLWTDGNGNAMRTNNIATPGQRPEEQNTNINWFTFGANAVVNGALQVGRNVLDSFASNPVGFIGGAALTVGACVMGGPVVAGGLALWSLGNCAKNLYDAVDYTVDRYQRYKQAERYGDKFTQAALAREIEDNGSNIGANCWGALATVAGCKGLAGLKSPGAAIGQFKTFAGKGIDYAKQVANYARYWRVHINNAKARIDNFVNTQTANSTGLSTVSASPTPGPSGFNFPSVDSIWSATKDGLQYGKDYAGLIAGLQVRNLGVNSILQQIDERTLQQIANMNGRTYRYTLRPTVV